METRKNTFLRILTAFLSITAMTVTPMMAVEHFIPPESYFELSEGGLLDYFNDYRRIVIGDFDEEKLLIAEYVLPGNSVVEEFALLLYQNNSEEYIIEYRESDEPIWRSKDNNLIWVTKEKTEIDQYLVERLVAIWEKALYKVRYAKDEELLLGGSLTYYMINRNGSRFMVGKSPSSGKEGSIVELMPMVSFYLIRLVLNPEHREEVMEDLLDYVERCENVLVE